MLCFIIQEIGFVENINFKSTFFWVFFLPTYFLLFFLLSNTWIDRWSKAPETLKDKNDSESKAIKTKYEANIHNKTNKEEHETMKTPEIDKEQIEKQFCYDSLNLCPYCNTKFGHNALHCAVYFSDIERLKEVIDLIYKAYKIDDCLTNLQINTYLFAFDRMIFREKDFRHINVIDLAILIGNVDSIKLLLQAAGTYYIVWRNRVYDNNGINNRICMYPEDESIKQMISIYQYKKHQTGKDILDKDDKNPLSKGYSKTPN